VGAGRADQAQAEEEGARARLFAEDGDDLGTREFSVSNWSEGDTVALADRVYRVYRVVYLDDDAEVRGMLMFDEPPTSTS
jgi:hypothetical protein